MERRPFFSLILAVATASAAGIAACFPSISFVGDGADGGPDTGSADDGGSVGPDGESSVDADTRGDGGPDSARPPDGGPSDAGAAWPGSPIAVGFGHACVIHGTDHRLACWGHNGREQLGRTTNGSDNQPVADVTFGVPATALTDVAEVVAGRDHTCARTFGGTLYCFGAQAVGAVGTGIHPPGIQTTAIPLPAGATAIAAVRAISDRTCAITVTSQIYCWGAGDFVGDAAWDRPTALLPTIEAGVKDFAIGQIDTPGVIGHQCAIAKGSNDPVLCWGLDDDYQCGVAATATCSGIPCILAPTATGVTNAVAVSAAQDNSCAIAGDAGTLFCWGTEYSGQLGLVPGPREPSGGGNHRAGAIAAGGDAGTQPLRPVVAVSVGYRHICAIVGPTRRLVCWGDPADGKLGIGPSDAGPVETPSPVLDLAGAPLEGVRAVAAGLDQTCAVKTDGTTYCWGLNTGGVLGVPSGSAAMSDRARQVVIPD